jgi:nudix-type nucleoside diphosphatase (YffH/AdpP family)
MGDQFVYGTLCHRPLLEAVLGRVPDAVPGRLAGHAVHWAEGGAFPLIVERPGSVAEGLLLRGLDAGDRARLDFYEDGFAFAIRDMTVETAAGPVVARVYFPEAGQWRPGAPWRLADWAARWGEIVTATARDVMALHGAADPKAVLARYPQMLVRGASRLRASQAAPTGVRHRAAPGDVDVERRRQTYAHYFAVEEYDLSFRRFDGSRSEVVNRAVFVSGDAVTVLPYDPVRDRVLLIEQFRAGPFARGDGQPWQLEAIAGRIDPGEDPETCARREAVEEAGLTLGAMELVAAYYPSPGAKSEFLYSYVALCDLPDGVAGTHGMAEEAEDIRGHLMPFDRLMDLVASGAAGNAPLILTAFWLARERDRLRAGRRTGA